MNGISHVPLINGVEPSWACIEVLVGSLIPETAIVAIAYGESQVKENHYGAGKDVVARGYGNVEPNASITVMKSAVENFRKASPTGRLTDIAPFDIVVSYLPPNSSLKIVDVVKNVEFLEEKVDTKQGDTKIEVTLPLIVSHVLWDGKK